MARRRAGVFEAPSNVVSVQRVESGAEGFMSTADTWRALGETARDINRRLQPALNQHAEAQARRDFDAGRAHLRTILTGEDEAYNNAMAQSYLLRAETDVESRTMELETEHGLDVEAFDQSFDAARGEFIANAPPDFATHIGALLDTQHAAARQRIGQRRRNAALEALQQDGQARLQYQEATLSGFTDLNAPEFAEAWDRYSATGEALTANPLSGFTAEEWTLRRDNTLSRLQARTFVESALALYEDGGRNAQSAQASLEAAAALIYDPALTLSPAQREAAYNDVRQAVGASERERRASERELRAELREYRAASREEARDLIAGVQARARSFVVIDDVTMNELRQSVEASGSPSLARQFSEEVIENEARRRLQGRSLVEIETQLQVWQALAAAGGEHAADAAVALNAGRAYANNLRRGDPLTVAQQHFGAPPPPLVTSDGQVNVGARIRHAEAVTREVGAARPTYLTPAEREHLAGVARQGGEEALTVARAIVGAAFAEEGDGFARAQRIMEEIAGSGGDALMSAGTVLLLGGESSATAARHILRAQELRQAPGYQARNVAALDNRGREDALARVLGRRNGGLSQIERTQLRYTTDLLFEGRVAADPGRAENPVQVYEDSARMALGAVTRDGRVYGGVADGVVIPNWIRADQFMNLRRSLTHDDYLAGSTYPGNAPPVPLSVLRSARLVPAGRPGAYFLADSSGDYLPVAPNVSYVLDLNAIRDRLAERRPDAVRQ